jgi:acetyl-CoA C-acetyltransferase
MKGYVVAARRSALGRIGGLHRSRRIEDLAAPVLAAALADARLSASDVDEFLLGNVTQGGNPARLVALAAGLPDKTPAATIDRQCASGLDAIVAALRMVSAGEADVVVAGGAESLSTAPWRIARPRTIHQQPRFITLIEDGVSPDAIALGPQEQLAERYQISRLVQDSYVLASRKRAAKAHAAKHFQNEIVPIRNAPAEGKDENLAAEIDADDLADLPVLGGQTGTLTSGNTSAGHDGAAFAVIVSEAVWLRLGKPPALQLVASAASGTSLGEEGSAPIDALHKLYQRMNGFERKRITSVELNEASAAQAIAVRDSLGFNDEVLNRDGGAVARGHAAGASGAVLVARLFTRLVREREAENLPCGIAVTGALGGLGVAALFEGV